MHLFFLVFPATLGNTRKKTFGVGDRLLKNSMHEAHGCGEDYSHGSGWGLHRCWGGNRRAGASFPNKQLGDTGAWKQERAGRRLGGSLAIGGYFFREKSRRKEAFQRGGKRRDFQIRATFFLFLLAAVQAWVPMAGVGLPRCRKCMLRLMYLSHSFY